MTVTYAVKPGGLLTDFSHLRYLYQKKGFSVSEIEILALKKDSNNPEEDLIHLHSPLSSMDRRDQYEVLGQPSIRSLFYRHMRRKIDVPFLEARRENDYGSYLKMTDGEVDITMIANEGRGPSFGRLALGMGSGFFVSQGVWATAMQGPEQLRPLLFLSGLAMGAVCLVAGFHGAQPVEPSITTTIEGPEDRVSDLESLASLARHPQYL